MSADQRFFDFLKRQIGLDVASVGPAIIERAVRQRCTALNMADHDQYWQWLNSSQDEQQALIESVIVPETWFFRYPESFVTLGRLARERLAAHSSPRVLRILSLPCSTGEEPYSIAMAMFDAGFAAHQFKVDALDVSPLSVQRAQRAVDLRTVLLVQLAGDLRQAVHRLLRLPEQHTELRECLVVHRRGALSRLFQLGAQG